MEYLHLIVLHTKNQKLNNKKDHIGLFDFQRNIIGKVDKAAFGIEVADRRTHRQDQEQHSPDDVGAVAVRKIGQFLPGIFLRGRRRWICLRGLPGPRRGLSGICFCLFSCHEIFLFSRIAVFESIFKQTFKSTR